MRRVLIIDDEAAIREIVAVVLETFAGWSVEGCASGKEGLEAVKANAPDAILLDVTMPDMDGIAVLRQLQRDVATTSIPVIFLTAKVQAADLKQFASLGLAGVIHKPFDPCKLTAIVAETLGWQAEV